MTTVTVQDARRQFDELLDLVARGEEVELTDATKPIARIVPIASDLDEKEVDWSPVRRRFNALWGGKIAPGKPASQIIIDDRR